MDDDELVEKEHIVAAAKQRFGVSQEQRDNLGDWHDGGARCDQDQTEGAMVVAKTERSNETAMRKHENRSKVRRTDMILTRSGAS